MAEDLTDVQQSVLKTLQRFERAVLFDELFYACDEVLSEEDVEQSLEDLERMELVKYVESDTTFGGGYISID